MSYDAQDDTTPLSNDGYNSPKDLKQAKTGCCSTPLQLLFGFILLVLLGLSIACCTLLGVFHSHLMFLCSYAEFMSLIVLQGVVIIFCGYHFYHIYRFFAPAQEEDDRASYSQVDEENEEDMEDENEFENSTPMRILFFCLKFIAVIISVLAFLSLVALTVTGITVQQISLPLQSGTLTLPGLKAPVTVGREANGMIHITAQTSLDAAFAQGVVMAQERMWQLEFHRRLANGTLAEIAGPEALDTDKWSRTIGFYRSAAANLNSLSTSAPEVMEFLQSFCNGINAYIATGQHLAPEFSPLILNTKPQPWAPVDVLALSKTLSWGLGVNAEIETVRFQLLQQGISMQRINQLYPLYPSDGPTVLSAEDLNLNVTQEQIDALNRKFTNDAGAFIPPLGGPGSYKKPYSQVNGLLKKFISSIKASNNWVIGPGLTKDGNAFLANDPHLLLTAPNVWILMHLKVEGSFNIIGATFAGVPGILIGQNDNIAWGVTNSAADVQDLYVMEDVGNNQYKYNGQNKDYSITQEVIKVKNNPDVTLDVKSSIYGPVINDIFGINFTQSISLSYIATQPGDTTVVSFYKLKLAKNWDDFVNALSYYVAPSQNFVFADRNNNIGYYMPGKIPIRKEGHSGRYPVSGNGQWDYQGYIPFSQLPHVYNPKKQFIASANNRVTPPGYNYSVTLDWETKYRAERITEMILEQAPYKNITFEDVQKMQLDVTSLLFREFKDVFIRIKGNISEEAETWRHKLENWDGVMSEGLEEPAVFEQWYNMFASVVAQDEIGGAIWTRYPMYLREILKADELACLTPQRNLTCTGLAAFAFNQSIITLEDNFGGTAPLWGTDVHEAQFKHAILGKTPLSCMVSKSVYIVGGSDTVNVGDTHNETLATTEGVSYRQIITMSNSTVDKFILPLGQSGNWLSKMYDNFIYMWRGGDYIDMNMNNPTIAYTLTLKSN